MTASSVDAGLDLISSLIDDLLAMRRRSRRQETASSATTHFSKPTTCSEFLSGLQLLTAALTLDHEDYNPTRALDIVEILKTMSADDFSCDASMADTLKEQVASGKEKANAVINEQETIISEETAKYNDAVAEIHALNAKLNSLGASTLEAGTTVSTVAHSESTTVLSTNSFPMESTTGSTFPTPGTTTPYLLPFNLSTPKTGQSYL